MFNKLAQEVFQILKGSGKTLTLFNDEGTQIYKPEDARKFFAEPENFVISINENGTDSTIAMYLSKAADISSDKGLVTLIDTLRNVATRHNILFNVRKYAKELKPKDFAYQAEIKEGAEAIKEYNTGDMETNANVWVRPIADGNKLVAVEFADFNGVEHRTTDRRVLDLFIKKQKLFRVYPEEVVSFVKMITQMGIKEGIEKMTMYGSSKTSYQRVGDTRLIIRHTAPVKEGVIGSRGRNIRSIFVENAAGERFLFPQAHLAGARAMAAHINAGGKMADDIGTYIVGLSEQYVGLAKVSNHILKNRSSLEEGVDTVRDGIRDRAKSIRLELGRVVRNYETFTESFQAPALVEGEETSSEIARLATLLNLNEGSAEFDALKYAAPYTAKAAVVEEPVDEAPAVAPAPAPAVQDAYTKYASQWLAKHGGELSGGDTALFARSLKLIAANKLPGTPTIPKNARFVTPDDEYRVKLAAWLAPEHKIPATLSNYITDLTDKLAEGRKLTPNEKFFADLLVAKVGLKEGFMEEHELEEWFKQFDPMKVLTKVDEAEECDEEDCEDEEKSDEEEKVEESKDDEPSDEEEEDEASEKKIDETALVEYELPYGLDPDLVSYIFALAQKGYDTNGIQQAVHRDFGKTMAGNTEAIDKILGDQKLKAWWKSNGKHLPMVDLSIDAAPSARTLEGEELDILGGDDGDDLVADITFDPNADHSDPEGDEIEASKEAGEIPESEEFNAIQNLRRLAGV